MSVEHEMAAWRLACAAGAPFPFRGVGLSMFPALRPGDEALFAPLGREPPRPGEVLLYRAGDALVAHRLLGVAADGSLRLRGDFMDREDPPLAAAAVLGRLVAVRRAGRELGADRGVFAVYARLLPVLHRHAPRAASAWARAVRLAVRLTPSATRG